MKNIFLIALTLFTLSASITSRADMGNTKNSGSVSTNRFIGLWEAVDPEDGAHNIISITNNGDSTFKVLLYATYFTTCNGGRGLVQGTGNVSSDSVLKVDEFIVTCFETNKTVTLPATFTRNSDGTLTWDRSAEPAPPPPTVIFHKTSK